MADRETCTWTGASGEKYKYFVYLRHPSMKEGQDGNYIYSRKNEKGQWVPIYIGEGDLSKRATPDHHRVECIDEKKATHVHLRLNADEDTRKSEEKDLLARYTNALEQNGGCNISPTG